MKTEKISGALAVLRSLIHENVELIFGYPGGAIMPIYDALFDLTQSLKHVLVRHEQGAIHAADGYARISSKVGVCFATSGPGATNLITGIANAMLDSIPIVCITGQISSPFLGLDAFQESNIVSMTAAVTKWNTQITSAEEIAPTLAKAFFIAQTGRPGPVLIDITKDAQFAFVEYSYQKYKNQKKEPFIKEQDLLCNIQEAAKLINTAKKPFILAGHGILLSKAESELLDLAIKAQIPVACTLLGLSTLSSDNKLFIGILGMHGHYGANILTNEADVIIAIGMRFDDRVTGNLSSYAKNAKIIHIDIDSSEINKNVFSCCPIIGDAKKVLQLLLPEIKKSEHREWLNAFEECKKIEYDKIISYEISSQGTEIKMAEVIHLLSEKTNGQAIIVSDVGQHQMITARYYKFKNKNLHITSGGLGTMGFALPAAIGAKYAAPQKQVIAVIGDGGFQMTLQELAVLMQENLDIKIIILNNGYLGMVKQWQELFFDNRRSFTELQNPDFVKIAEAYKIKAKRISDHNQLDLYLNEMIQSQCSYLLEIMVKKENNVFPMIPAGAGVHEIRLS